MKLQPHYFCPQGVKPRKRAGTPRIRKGDVKACYVRINRRWTRIGTICLHCRQFASELDTLQQESPKKQPGVPKQNQGEPRQLSSEDDRRSSEARRSVHP